MFKAPIPDETIYVMCSKKNAAQRDCCPWVALRWRLAENETFNSLTIGTDVKSVMITVGAIGIDGE